MCFSIGDRADGASAAKTFSAFYLKEMFLVATILVFCGNQNAHLNQQGCQFKLHYMSSVVTDH